MRLDPGLERAIELRVKLAEGEIDAATFCAAVRETGRPDPLAESIEGECLLSEGDTAAAEECFWRSAELAPWSPVAYLWLRDLKKTGAESEETHEVVALHALYLLKLAGCEAPWSDGQLDPMPREQLERLLEATEIDVDANALDAAERAWVAGKIFLKIADQSADAADRRLLFHARLARVFEEEMTREDVDGLPGEGERTARALGAIVEGHAKGLLGRTGENAIQNALALLGELGATGMLGTVLAATAGLESNSLVAAIWAMRRWLHLDPAGFAEEVRRLRPDLEPDDIEWLAMALVKAGLGERFGPAWDALFDAATAMDCLPGRAGMALALSSRIMFTQSGSERLDQVKRSSQRYSEEVMQEHLEPVLSLTEEDFAMLREDWAWQRPDVYRICARDGNWAFEVIGVLEEDAEDAEPGLS